MANRSLHKARAARNDEFFTQLPDIENELAHYEEHFRGKIIFCNCDDPASSSFFQYFDFNFEFRGLKKLIATHYTKEKPSYKLEFQAGNNRNKNNKCEHPEIPLKENGDFRSHECIELLKEADIVVTNPPFSLFREYISQLIEYDKKFIIIGSMNALTYKETIQLIKENKLWLGNKKMGTDMLFDVSKDFAKELVATKKEGSGYKIVDGVVKARASAIWFTNLDYQERHKDLILYKKYRGNESEYPKYDNYDAINIDKVENIPMDYSGAMGVPISFLDKYNPKQFKIIDCNNIRLSKKIPFKEHGLIKDSHGSINGKPKYVRIVIENRNPKKYKL